MVNNTQIELRPGVLFRSVAPLALILATCGCATVGGWITSLGEDSDRQRGSDAMLVAARSRGISMFGEGKDVGTNSYFTRAGGSLRQHTFAEIGSDNDVDIDSSGERLVFSSTRHNDWPDLYVKSINGVAVTQLTSDPGADIQPAFSPDGSMIAFASNRGGNWDIWMVSVGGGQPVQVTSAPGDEVHPSWSPDGTRLVFCSKPVTSGQWQLWVTDAAVGATPRFVGYGLFPEWSPAGETILFQRARQRGSRQFSVWTLTLVQGEPRYPTEIASDAQAALVLPTWSADGRRLAFVSIGEPQNDKEGRALKPASDIWVMWSDGRGKVRLTDGYTGNHSPAFGPDGWVFFTADRAGHHNIWSVATNPESLSPDGGIGIRTASDDRTAPVGPVRVRSGS